MNKTTKGVLLLTAVASLAASAADKNAAKAKKDDKTAAKVRCEGINECKGKGECAAADYGCAGNNECKGKGWIVVSAKECTDKHGKNLGPASN